MGTARAPVLESGTCPAWTMRVSKPNLRGAGRFVIGTLYLKPLFIPAKRWSKDMGRKDADSIFPSIKCDPLRFGNVENRRSGLFHEDDGNCFNFIVRMGLVPFVRQIIAILLKPGGILIIEKIGEVNTPTISAEIVSNIRRRRPGNR